MIKAIESGVAVGEYTYNGNGQRVKKVIGAQTTIFHYSLGGQLIAESDSTGVITAEYAYLLGQPLAKIETDNIYFYHNDHLATPMVMTDETGSIVWEGEYLPFGEEISITGSITNNLRFPGQYYDEETGLHYNLFRDYHPMIGRYIEADPIGLRGGISLYAYVGNNSLNHFDPLGLFCIEIWRKTIGSEFDIWKEYWKFAGSQVVSVEFMVGWCYWHKIQEGWMKKTIRIYYLCCEECSCTIKTKDITEEDKYERVIQVKTTPMKFLPVGPYSMVIHWCEL